MQGQLPDYLLLGSAAWRYFVKAMMARYVAPRAPLPPGAAVLDVGGGAGASSLALLSLFRVGRLEYIDSDPRLYTTAARRLSGRAGVRLSLMDATRLTFPAESFD